MQISLKRKLAFGTAALAMAAFGGGAFAAAQDSSTNSGQAFLNDVAKRLKVTPGELTAALQGAFADQLAAAVAAGRLTQAQANQINQRTQQRGVVPYGGPLLVPGGLGAHRLFERPGVVGGPLGGGLDAVASYLGLTSRAMREQLDAGRSLAGLAAAKHKSVSGLEAAIIAAIRTRLDKAAGAKQITSAQEQQILSRLSTRVEELVNRAGDPPHFGPRGFFGHVWKRASLPAGPLPAPQAPPGPSATIPPAVPMPSIY